MKKKIVGCLLILLAITMTVSAEENRKKYTGKGVKLEGETEWTNPSSFSSTPFIEAPKPLVRKKISKKEKLKREIEKNINTITKIAEKYYETHDYSEYYGSVCRDMAIDIWGLIERKGIDALIVVGNPDKPIYTVADIKHAWILAEVAPSLWVAVETTDGRTISYDENPGYYRGVGFDVYSEYKKHDDLRKEYIQQLKRIEELGPGWPSYDREVEKLRDIADRWKKFLLSKYFEI